MRRLGMPCPCPGEVLLEAAEVVDCSSVNRAWRSAANHLQLMMGCGALAISNLDLLRMLGQQRRSDRFAEDGVDA
jgi:hypothetical protein